MKNYFEDSFIRSISVKKDCINNGFSSLEDMGTVISDSILSGGKLMICGNGGSAADAQHLAAELLVRLRSTHNRRPIAALSLAMDISTLTACGNDYSFDDIYERSLLALGKKNDCLLGISTSGNSNNIYKAMKAAKEMGIKTLGMLGGDGGICKDLCDISYIVPSYNTAAIQEAHITMGHALMEMVEDSVLEN